VQNKMMIEVKTKSAKEKESRMKGERDESAEEERWRSESDARTLMEAEKIKSDKPRYAKAQSIAKEQAAALLKVSK
jgi:hypothetical protein